MIEKLEIDLNKKRENKTKDIVKRIGVITPNRIFLENFPLKNPITSFNPSCILENEILILYTRIILGYYAYVSSIAEIKIPIEDLENISKNYYNGKIVVFPENRYDIYGCEDPRTSKLDNKIYMVYAGRTVSYFDPNAKYEKTLPIISVYENSWKKKYVFKIKSFPNKSIISDKDAFLFKLREDYYIFHRPHIDNNFYLFISKLGRLDFEGELKEIYPKNSILVLEPAKFETKIGWGTPLLKIDKEYIAFLHALDKDKIAYRVFAMLFDKDLHPISVTPYYIMEPKENYEKFGDRPFVVFPCGICKIDDKIIITYGSADFAIGIGEIDISEILSILDKNKIE